MQPVVIPRRRHFAARNLLLAGAVGLPARNTFLPFGVGMTTAYGELF